MCKLNLQESTAQELVTKSTDYIAEKDYLKNAIKVLEDTTTRGDSKQNKNMFPAFLVAAGSGGGKTRLLGELFKYYAFNEHETSTVLFITFNNEGVLAQDRKEDKEKFTGHFLFTNSSIFSFFNEQCRYYIWCCK